MGVHIFQLVFSITFDRTIIICLKYITLFITDGPSSSILQFATIPVLDNSKCAIAYSNKAIIDDTILCAGHAQGEKDACKGDSGGRH